MDDGESCVEPTILQRIVIYPKDIERITGRANRTAHRIMEEIREKYGKESHQMVSIYEFCAYTGLPEAHVRRFL